MIKDLSGTKYRISMKIYQTKVPGYTIPVLVYLLTDFVSASEKRQVYRYTEIL